MIILHTTFIYTFWKHTYVYIYTYICTYAYMDTSKNWFQKHIIHIPYTCIHKSIHKVKPFMDKQPMKNICTTNGHIDLQTWIHLQIHIHTYIHTFIHSYSHARPLSALSYSKNLCKTRDLLFGEARGK